MDANQMPELQQQQTTKDDLIESNVNVNVNDNVNNDNDTSHVSMKQQRVSSVNMQQHQEDQGQNLVRQSTQAIEEQGHCHRKGDESDGDGAGDDGADDDGQSTQQQKLPAAVKTKGTDEPKLMGQGESVSHPVDHSQNQNEAKQQSNSSSINEDDNGKNKGDNGYNEEQLKEVQDNTEVIVIEDNDDDDDIIIDDERHDISCGTNVAVAPSSSSSSSLSSIRFPLLYRQNGSIEDEIPLFTRFKGYFTPSTAAAAATATAAGDADNDPDIQEFVPSKGLLQHLSFPAAKLVTCTRHLMKNDFQSMVFCQEWITIFNNCDNEECDGYHPLELLLLCMNEQTVHLAEESSTIDTMTTNLFLGMHVKSLLNRFIFETSSLSLDVGGDKHDTKKSHMQLVLPNLYEWTTNPMLSSDTQLPLPSINQGKNGDDNDGNNDIQDDKTKHLNVIKYCFQCQFFLARVMVYMSIQGLLRSYDDENSVDNDDDDDNGNHHSRRTTKNDEKMVGNKQQQNETKKLLDTCLPYLKFLDYHMTMSKTTTTATATADITATMGCTTSTADYDAGMAYNSRGCSFDMSTTVPQKRSRDDDVEDDDDDDDDVNANLSQLSLRRRRMEKSLTPLPDTSHSSNKVVVAQRKGRQRRKQIQQVERGRRKSVNSTSKREKIIDNVDSSDDDDDNDSDNDKTKIRNGGRLVEKLGRNTNRVLATYINPSQAYKDVHAYYKRKQQEDEEREERLKNTKKRRRRVFTSKRNHTMEPIGGRSLQSLYDILNKGKNLCWMGYRWRFNDGSKNSTSNKKGGSSESSSSSQSMSGASESDSSDDDEDDHDDEDKEGDDFIPPNREVEQVCLRTGKVLHVFTNPSQAFKKLNAEYKKEQARLASQQRQKQQAWGGRPAKQRRILQQEQEQEQQNRRRQTGATSLQALYDILNQRRTANWMGYSWRFKVDTYAPAADDKTDGTDDDGDDGDNDDESVGSASTSTKKIQQGRSRFATRRSRSSLSSMSSVSSQSILSDPSSSSEEEGGDGDDMYRRKRKRRKLPTEPNSKHDIDGRSQRRPVEQFCLNTGKTIAVHPTVSSAFESLPSSQREGIRTLYRILSRSNEKNRTKYGDVIRERSDGVYFRTDRRPHEWSGFGWRYVDEGSAGWRKGSTSTGRTQAKTQQQQQGEDFSDDGHKHDDIDETGDEIRRSSALTATRLPSWHRKTEKKKPFQMEDNAKPPFSTTPVSSSTFGLQEKQPDTNKGKEQKEHVPGEARPLLLTGKRAGRPIEQICPKTLKVVATHANANRAYHTFLRTRKVTEHKRNLYFALSQKKSSKIKVWCGFYWRYKNAKTTPEKGHEEGQQEQQQEVSTFPPPEEEESPIHSERANDPGPTAPNCATNPSTTKVAEEKPTSNSDVGEKRST